MSSDYRCRSFNAQAQGTVASESLEAWKNILYSKLILATKIEGKRVSKF